MIIDEQIGKPLEEEQVVALARLALVGIQREYPCAPGHVVQDAGPQALPRQLHPVFFGCYDWHSAIHSHWMLLRLLKLYPTTAVAPHIHSLLNHQFTAAKLQAEADYFTHHPTFERMYGWGWGLRLALELHTGNVAPEWIVAYRPLETTLVQLIQTYLPRLAWPIRCGFHPESAFPLGQFLDYARGLGNEALARLVEAKSLAFYAADRGYPAAYEPSGHDFFSAGLNEADLMRRVLPPAGFSAWLEDFLPGLASGQYGNLLTPVGVSDVQDGGLIHLAGLNLSRAWTMHAIAQALPTPADPRKTVLTTAAGQHAAAGLEYVFTGSYMGEHWLASFAVYLLTEVGR